MALAAATTWEVRTTGSDTACSGGFVTGASGSDYSQQDAAAFSGTDLSVDPVSNTKVQSASHNFVATDVGNLIQITAGIGFTTGFYQIISVASNEATLDRSPGTIGITGGTWALGGALASPAKPLGAVVAGNTIHVKSGTYSVTTTSSNVAGGILNFNVSGSATARIRLIGYGATRGDNGTKPVIQSTVNSVTLVTLNNVNSYNSLENIEVDGNAKTSNTGINAQGRCNYLLRCRVRTCTGNGINVTNNVGAYLCETTGCTGGATGAFVIGSSGSGNPVWGCTSHDNTARGFDIVGGGTSAFCLAYNNSGANGYGFYVEGAMTSIPANCVAYGNAQDGFYLSTGNTNLTCVNCLSVNSGGFGFNHNSAPHCLQLLNCAAYNNTSGNYPTSGSNTPQLIENFQALTATPFTNAAGGDFSLNNTAGGGAACRAAGIPGAFPGGLTRGYLDLGAVQHADPAGGGLRRADMSGGLTG